ncbi:type IV pilus biogenesis/stability protein PilW [Thiococcus pfennigii]|jgi:type IV pilus assembly protein PilF|uniref:type IV pilus biogenesis/stability protein PilW n=1 Tax=Thiococcus pfennigii TaxID=1057 RepID=UPI0019054F1A|nr:type IV pilus biogenesis/stability protein PilW [Thiococcus pfennigii]MBK1702425.1 type IV pilus biogenesis/stability protein PilW [Thiococcus pfennigii]MBK1730218.1 type IV pilus biogenesis/stability protein PilW [Thiococcus pfennigii]
MTAVMRLPRLAVTIGFCTLLGACATPQNQSSGEGIGKLSAQETDSPADLYVALASEYYRIGQMDPALDRARRALELDRNNARAHYVAAVILQRLREDALAETHFRRAIELEPNNPDIRNAWGAFLCAQKRYAEADAQFAEALANPLYNTPALALTNAGLCAVGAGDKTKGENYLRQALTREPRFAPALYQMAEIQYARGDYKSAQGYLERLMQGGQLNPRALLLAVRVEKALGNRKQANVYTEYLRKGFPDAPEVLEL